MESEWRWQKLVKWRAKNKQILAFLLTFWLFCLETSLRFMACWRNLYIKWERQKVERQWGEALCEGRTRVCSSAAIFGIQTKTFSLGKKKMVFFALEKSCLVGRGQKRRRFSRIEVSFSNLRNITPPFVWWPRVIVGVLLAGWWWRHAMQHSCRTI